MRRRWDWDAAVKQQTNWNKTTSELIKGKREEAMKVKEVFVELFQKMGFTLQRWHFSDSTGIVKLTNDASLSEMREYHTYHDCDRFVYEVLRSALTNALDEEEFVGLLESIYVNDEEHDRSGLHANAEHIFAKTESNHTSMKDDDHNYL